MPPDDDISVCGLLVSNRTRSVLFDGHALGLTPREFEILARLVAHPGWVLSAAELSDETDDVGYSPESVSVHVAHLRRKLVAAGAPDLVETVRGFGYRVRPDAADGDGPGVGGMAGAGLNLAAWQLFEAIIEVVRFGNLDQQTATAEELERARRALFAILSR